MIYKITNAKTAFLLAIAAMFCLFAATFDAGGQTVRRRTRRYVPPVASPTPLPPQSVPEIISRAEDIPSENQIIAPQTSSTQPSPETLDDKVDKFNSRVKELNSRVKTLESSQKNEYDEKQKRLLLNLDILTRAEQRTDALRKQLFDLVEKENNVQTRLDQIEYESRPEIIDRAANLTGSLRPEEIRDQRQKSLGAEKKNLESLLAQIQTSRAALEANVQKADELVEKVRAKMEKEIDDALAEDKKE